MGELKCNRHQKGENSTALEPSKRKSMASGWNQDVRYSEEREWRGTSTRDGTEVSEALSPPKDSKKVSAVSENILRANISNLSSDVYSSPFLQVGLRYNSTVYQSEILCTSCIAYLQQQLSLSLSQAETHSQQPVCPSPRQKLSLYPAFTTASLSLSPRPKCIHNSQSVPLSQAEMHSQQPVCPSPRLTLSLYLAFTTASLSLSLPG